MLKMKENESVGGKSFAAGFMGCLGVLGAIVVVLVVIGVLFAVSTQDDSNINENPTTTQATTSGQPTSTIKEYKLGEQFEVSGDFLGKQYKWKITKTDLSKLSSFVWDSGLTPKTYTPKYDKYYVINFRAINEANENFDLESTFTGQVSDLVLVDSQGKKYSGNFLDDVNSAYSTQMDFISKTSANPGAVASSFVMYDVPDGSYKLCDNELKEFCIEGVK